MITGAIAPNKLKDKVVLIGSSLPNLGGLRPTASMPLEPSVQIHADASLYAGLLDGADAVTLALNPARKAYVFLARGSLQVNGQPLSTGDAALLSAESTLHLHGAQQAEVLVFDLAA